MLTDKIARWLGKPVVPATAPGERVYAIGDIHGRADLFFGLLHRISEENAQRDRNVKTRLIVLGDFIDRGPHSLRIIQALRSYQNTGANLTVLLGNHEWLLLHALLGNPSAQDQWLACGGEAFLRSVDLSPPGVGVSQWAFAELLAEAIGEDTIDWLRSLPVSTASGSYFFCHAGVAPGVALARQTEETLLTIREPFMTSEANHGAVVVHGHNRVSEAEIRHNRISLDTCAYDTGRLSAVGLEGTAQWLLEFRGAIQHKGHQRRSAGSENFEASA